MYKPWLPVNRYEVIILHGNREKENVKIWADSSESAKGIALEYCGVITHSDISTKVIFLEKKPF